MRFDAGYLRKRFGIIQSEGGMTARPERVEIVAGAATEIEHGAERNPGREFPQTNIQGTMAGDFRVLGGTQLVEKARGIIAGPIVRPRVKSSQPAGRRIEHIKNRTIETTSR